MSNQIIKDFKGWNLLTEDTDMKNPISSNSPLKSPKANLNFSNPIPGVTPPTSEPTPAKPAAAKVKAAPPVPTADLKTANAAALTRNDWAAIQTKLNVANLDLPQILNKEVSTNPNPLGLDIPLINTKANESRPITKLYESLVPDGLFGPLTLAAVADFVTKYNATPAGTAAPLPTTPPTATTIDPLVLAAIAAPAAPATSTTDTKTVAPTDTPTPAGKMTLAAAKAAVVIMQKIRTAAGGPGTDDELFITSITTPTTADDFYNLNAMLKKEYGMTIAEIINDEFGTDDLKYAKRIKTYLDGLKIESSFTSSKGAMSYENTENNIFTEGSFKITIPAGKDPDTLYPAITNRNELYS